MAEQDAVILIFNENNDCCISSGMVLTLIFIANPNRTT